MAVIVTTIADISMRNILMKMGRQLLKLVLIVMAIATWDILLEGFVNIMNSDFAEYMMVQPLQEMEKLELIKIIID